MLFYDTRSFSHSVRIKAYFQWYFFTILLKKTIISVIIDSHNSVQADLILEQLGTFYIKYFT